MPLPANLQREKAATPLSFKDVNRVTRIAVLVAGGLILFLFESAIPRPLPWLKPGLSNLVTLIAFYLFGFRIAFVIMLLRVVTGAFILGTLFNPVFLFGLSGGIVATGMMGLFYFYFKKIFSILGISILGAFTHNLV
ncbi:MAG: Gx transporter family protein, partial [bacterium]